MTGSQSLVQAGSVDSQDSQAILDAYTAEFGVATVRSQCRRELCCTGRRPLYSAQMLDKQIRVLTILSHNTARQLTSKRIQSLKNDKHLHQTGPITCA